MKLPGWAWLEFEVKGDLSSYRFVRQLSSTRGACSVSPTGMLSIPCIGGSWRECSGGIGNACRAGKHGMSRSAGTS